MNGSSKNEQAAAELALRIDESFGNDGNINRELEMAQALNVVGEAGEFAESYRRYVGFARRPGDIEETSSELADVVIAAYVMACRLGIDLDNAIEEKWKKIFTRGFKDPR